MIQRREYDPAWRVHAADCPDAPPGAFVTTARAVYEAFPHDRPHRCLTKGYVSRNGAVVREQIHYEPHDWVPSTIVPADAIRALCRTCRGTRCANRGGPPVQVLPQTPSGLIIGRS
ncbi:hypothetical protein ACTI_15320 [Actinoplanes sp. OR16]|nr:hypothetical protein ACTI_15320 [Actinoplanes sp. OR16]